MVKIRLMRVGKIKQPSYRVVVADSRSPRDGRIIEAIGHYNPRTEPSTVEINTDRAVHWLRVGAQPSDQVRKLLQITGAWQEFKGAPGPSARPAEAAKRPTPAASVTATPAASVEEGSERGATREPEVAPTAQTAEAEEGAAAGIAPEATVGGEEEEPGS